MLGQTVSDPDGIEGGIPTLPGLGLLPIHTVMTPEKTTRQVTFDWEGHTCQGYEIHQGVSTPADGGDSHAATDVDATPFTRSGHCLGTYIHGFLDNKTVIDSLLAQLAEGSTPGAAGAASEVLSPADFRDHQYDLLADHVRRHIDIQKLYSIIAHD